MKLVLVSNREPYKIDKVGGKLKIEKTVGGLVSGFEPLLKKFGGVWVCWGKKGKTEGEVKISENFRIRHVPLTTRDINEYYYGYSNRTLWPLCHMFLKETHFDRDYWTGYRRVNKKFAREVALVAKEGSLIVINDYHLSLVPLMLKELGVKLPVYFFWHIPFPPYFTFRVLPNREEILRGILGADVIGFHTEHYKTNFILSVKNILGAEFDGNYIHWDGRKIKVKVAPLGIDTEMWERFARRPHVKRYVRSLKKKIGTEFIGIGVDRLDYTKGLEEKFIGLEKFFEKFPNFRGKVSFIQVAAPTRTKVKEYAEMRRITEEIVSRINGRFGEPGWVPVYYYYKNFSEEKLSYLYTLADFALVTPLIDGLNLVSKEYVASKVNNDGVLILSEFAGVSTQLKDGALIVNPFDEHGVADAVARALKMKEEEKKERMLKMREKIKKEDINWWVKTFLELS